MASQIQLLKSIPINGKLIVHLPIWPIPDRTFLTTGSPLPLAAHVEFTGMVTVHCRCVCNMLQLMSLRGRRRWDVAKCKLAHQIGHYTSVMSVGQ